MTMRMSADGRARLSVREGKRKKAYRDTVGVWTIGVGHTAAAGEPKPVPGMTLTDEQIDEILTRDLHTFEDVLNRIVKVPLSQGQFDALCSFAFNVPTHEFVKSTLIKKLNRGDYRGAADQIMKWLKPPELRGRRISERQQFLAGTDAPIAERRAVDPDAPPVSIKELRKAGSRTIQGADQVQGGLGGLGLSGGGALIVLDKAQEGLSKLQDLSSTVQGGADTLQSTTGALTWALEHWQLLALAVLLAAAAYFAWRIWRGARLVQRARVDDANSGLNIGR